MRTSRRRGVSAIISALLMVAIAVSLSAALFVSTTGYLSGLTGAIGNEQPGQNRAAQTLLIIESTTAKAYSTGFPTDGYVLLYVRNVGTVTLTLGSVTVTAPPTNGGQSKSFESVLTGSTWAQPYTHVAICTELTNSNSCDSSALCSSSVSSVADLTPNQTAEVWVAWCPGASPTPISGDAFQIQVTSTVGASNLITINVP